MLFKKKVETLSDTVTINKDEYGVKPYLTENEAGSFVEQVINMIFADTDKFDFYVVKNYAIHKAAIEYYAGYEFKFDKEDELINPIDDMYGVFKQIKSRFDKEQFEEIRQSIQDGINFKVAQMTSVMGDTSNMMDELNNMVDKIGVDKIGKIINIGEREQTIVQANKEVDAERAKTKKNKASK
jgi:hypothetical protein